MSGLGGHKATHRCPVCGYEMWSDFKMSGCDVSVLWFCPSDGSALDRLDPLGALEASGGTWDEFLAAAGEPS